MMAEHEPQDSGEDASLRRRWAIVLAPVAFVAVFELGRMGAWARGVRPSTLRLRWASSTS